jgi:hypothetical protein
MASNANDKGRVATLAARAMPTEATLTAPKLSANITAFLVARVAEDNVFVLAMGLNLTFKLTRILSISCRRLRSNSIETLDHRKMVRGAWTIGVTKFASCRRALRFRKFEVRRGVRR